MEKITIVSDIHGLDIWKQIVLENENSDLFLFLGDYLDSFNIPGMKQLENLMDIIEFKKANHDKVILLWGNHDHQYQKFSQNEIYSGYQTGMAHQFKFVLDDYKHLFQIAYQQDNYLFSHAGISDEWCNHSFGYWHVDNIVNRVNELYQYQPYHFHLQPGQSHCGQETYQGPLWIRPSSLMKANKQSDIKKKYIQIVGHTHLGQIDFKGKSTGGKYYFVDCLGEYGGEYLTINNGQLKLNVIKKYNPKYPTYE